MASSLAQLHGSGSQRHSVAVLLWSNWVSSVCRLNYGISTGIYQIANVKNMLNFVLQQACITHLVVNIISYMYKCMK